MAERYSNRITQFYQSYFIMKEVGKPHAHPAAPPEFQKSFSDFLAKFESSGSRSPSISSSSKQKSASDGSGAYREYWQAPVRLWDTRLRHLDETEIEAILVCS